MSLVVPAVLPSSKEDLEEKLGLFATFPDISRIQIDVVDGRFAAPASWPYRAPEEFSRMRESRELLPHLERFSYEIDLMCLDPLPAIEAWSALGATLFTLHAESTPDFPALLAEARERFGSDLITFGAALNIETDLARVEPVLGTVGYVQCMGIARIGRQGEPFDERVYEKIRVFRERHPNLSLQVDGGITLGSAKKLVALGVDRLVVGSGILRAADPISTLRALDALQSPFGV